MCELKKEFDNKKKGKNTLPAISTSFSLSSFVPSLHALAPLVMRAEGFYFFVIVLPAPYIVCFCFFLPFYPSSRTVYTLSNPPSSRISFCNCVRTRVSLQTKRGLDPPSPLTLTLSYDVCAREIKLHLCAVIVVVVGCAGSCACVRTPACGRCIGGGMGCDVGRYLHNNNIAVLADGCFNGLSKMTHL